MAKERPGVRGPTSSLVLALLVWSGGPGCKVSGNGPPQHYDDPGQMIRVFEAEDRDSWQMPDRVVRAIPIESKQAIVADIGAGSGYFTRRLAREVPEGRVYAVDVDGEFEDYLLANREAWGTPNIEPHLAHYDDPMLPLQGIDLVFSANTYPFIRDRVGYFTRVRKSLKPGGKLVLVDFRPDADVPSNIAPEPRHRIGVEAATAELAEAGFVVIGQEDFLPYQWMLVLEPSS